MRRHTDRQQMTGRHTMSLRTRHQLTSPPAESNAQPAFPRAGPVTYAAESASGDPVPTQRVSRSLPPGRLPELEQ